MHTTEALLQRMFSQADAWEKQGDQRYIFQRCYGMMSRNMASAIGDGRFTDGRWVEQLMQRFALYYFDAQELYDRNSPRTPAVWRQVHSTAREKSLHILQHLLLGINAHINYDLPLALYDELHGEWPALAEAQRQQRRTDHEMVNQVIGETIDSVQDTIIEPHSPLMAVVDRMMGRMDEWLLSQLIAGWRAEVWHVALDLLNTGGDPGQREVIRQEQEIKVLKRGEQLAWEELM